MTDSYISKHDTELIAKTLELFKDFLDEQRELLESDPLNLVSQEKAMKHFNISRPTILDWEKQGLTRYKAPEGRKVWYSKTELLNFLREGGKQCMK
ncbi:hypothetical protein [Streptococcus saliviloxodontae]|uniref:Transposase n=1 Tax=Streptococcus saliviloxodontae TaxID=1349416 RepID=A0ABS2PJR2_9STRE|nr:hypothetical protein [Streptococcus saliviloxodontae]MBM7635579.1 transposase [Streptococcus saliviloxodontae]